MRNKISKRFLAFLIATVMIFGSYSTAFASNEKTVENLIATNETRKGSEINKAGTGELVSAVDGLTVPDGLTEEALFNTISGPRKETDGKLSSNAQYVAEVAAMLTTTYESDVLAAHADDEVIEVMVWLQELPAALDRLYKSEGLSINGYIDVAADAKTARSDIKAMGAKTLKSRNAAPAIQIQYEYSEIFAGFAITAPVSELKKIAAMPGVFTVEAMAYYELDYIPDPNYITLGNLEAREIARIGELHAAGIDGAGIKVGVIDSGIQVNHPDLVDVYKGGYNFNSGNSNMNNPDGDHGTHVAGTIASQGLQSLGAAPAVDLYMAQVFPSGSNAVVTAAMEAFAGDGGAHGLPKVDVVNMSLGISSAAANSAYISGVYARNNMVLAGVTVVNSAGNSATTGLSNPIPDDEHWNYSVTSSNASLSIAVASTLYGSTANWLYSSDLGGEEPFKMAVANGDAKLSGIFLNNDFGNKSPITVTYNAGNTTGNPAWMDAEYYGTYTRQPLNYVEGLGYEVVYVDNPDPADDAWIAAWKAANPTDSLVGKILAFNRGFSFNTMYGLALHTGAGGVIMIDRDEVSTVNMTIGNVPSAHGVIFQAGFAMQAIMREAKEAGTIYFNPGNRETAHAAKELSAFSSIGPTMENAHIKPDIAAPGDNIFSTSLNNGYASMGGTSMSSPFVAGCAALLIQHLKATGQDYSPEAVKARLMNTADPYLIGPTNSYDKGRTGYYYNNDGTEASVYEQGSGYVNIWRAIYEDVYITVENDDLYTGLNATEKMTGNMASFSFGDVDKGEQKTMTATVNGLDDYEVEVSYNHNTRYSNKNEEMFVTVEVVKNGNTFDATVTIDEEANADKLNGGNLYEGYITVTGEGNSYVLPWAVRIPHVSIIPPEPQGDADHAKITLIADSSLSIYTPTIGASLWLDPSLQMIDLFYTEEGVEFTWMNANCLRVPSGAIAGGSVTTHLLINQTASACIPAGEYDTLAVAMQNASTFIGSGEFSEARAYEFEAGYEYVIRVTGSSGGNPAFNLEAKKTHNEGDDVEIPEGFSRVTLNVPTDVWGDGSGYQMWIDKDRTILGSELLEEIVAAADYKIPTNATLNGLGTDPVVFLNSANIIIPSGLYDFMLMNPVPYDGYYVVGGAAVGLVSGFAFEPNKHYTLTIVPDDLTGDRYELTVVDEDLEQPDPGLEPGTSPNAKVTFNHGAWGAAYNVNASIWLDSTNYMYDAFKTETGVTVDFEWMNANCTKLPETAVMLDRLSMFAPGEGGSIELTPDTYDILPIWSQTQLWDVFGIYTGDFVFEKEYPLEAGFEYIFTTDLVDGAPYLHLEIVPFDRPLNFDGVARITFDYDFDRWDDGSGYQMWFNSSGELFDMVADLGNLAGMTEADLAYIESICEYRIPENARLLSTANGPVILPFNSDTIEIEAGYYDYMTVNPDGARNWLASNENGLSKQKQFAFEADMHYTFKIIAVGTNDGVSLSIEETDYTVTPIEEVTNNIAAPVGGKTAPTTLSGDNYSGTIEWTPDDAKFYWETEYIASVTLKAKIGYEFDENVSITVPEGLDITNVVVDGRTLTYDVSFPMTGPMPDLAKVTFTVGDPYGDGSGYALLFDADNLNPQVNNLANYEYSLPEAILENIGSYNGNGVYQSTESMYIPAGIYSIHGGNWWSGGCWSFDTNRWYDFEVEAGYHYIFTKTATGAANWKLTVEPVTVEIESVVADNETGKLEITLNGDYMITKPVITEADFNVTWAGGIQPSDAEQQLSNFTYDAKTGIATYDFIPYEQLREDQSVVFTVDFRGFVMDSNEIFVPQFTHIEDIVIKFLTPGAVNVSRGKTIQLQIETDPYIDVANHPEYSITWVSLMPTIATVNATGLVRGISAGTAIVRATIVDPYGESITLNFTVYVK